MESIRVNGSDIWGRCPWGLPGEQGNDPQQPAWLTAGSCLCTCLALGRRNREKTPAMCSYNLSHDHYSPVRSVMSLPHRWAHVQRGHCPMKRTTTTS